MIEFIKDDIIKKDYIVFGSFYELVMSYQSIVPCRNSLEIYSRDVKRYNERKLYSHIPDALFIMMNPGASIPFEAGYAPPKIRIENLPCEVLQNSLVYAMPDKTQCQVMRVMKEKKWQHVRIINLSDICSGNRNIFFDKFNEFEKLCNSDIHSIFSKQREEERSLAFNIGKDTPVILAWGIDERLIHIASRYMPYIQSYKVRGISTNLYLHANPQRQDQKEIWLNNILNVL